MPIQSKPFLNRIWADSAPASNIEDPDTTSPGKFDAGWIAEVPPFQNFNFVWNLITKGLEYFNQQGIPAWDALTLYPVGGIVKASDGRLFKALVEQLGNNPTSVSNNWVLLQSTITGLETETGTSLTLELLNAGGVVEMDNAAANTVTVPPNSSVPFPLLTKIDVVQIGAGLTTLAEGAGVTIDGLLDSGGQGKALSLYKKSTDTWRVVGGV